jgi:hypothetical protein
MPSIIAGLLAFAIGLWGLSVWWYSVEELLRGLIPLLLLLFGMVALMAGVSRVATVSDDEKSDEELVDLDEEPLVEKRAVEKAATKKRAVVKKKAVKRVAETGEAKGDEPAKESDT